MNTSRMSLISNGFFSKIHGQVKNTQLSNKYVKLQQASERAQQKLQQLIERNDTQAERAESSRKNTARLSEELAEERRATRALRVELEESSSRWSWLMANVDANKRAHLEALKRKQPKRLPRVWVSSGFLQTSGEIALCRLYDGQCLQNTCVK